MTSPWRWPIRLAAFGYLGLLVVIPVASVFYRAFEHGLVTALNAVTTPDALHALWLTLLVVLIAVPLDTVFGVGVALILARHRFPARGCSTPSSTSRWPSRRSSSACR